MQKDLISRRQTFQPRTNIDILTPNEISPSPKFRQGETQPMDFTNLPKEEEKDGNEDQEAQNINKPKWAPALQDDINANEEPLFFSMIK